MRLLFNHCAGAIHTFASLNCMSSNALNSAWTLFLMLRDPCISSSIVSSDYCSHKRVLSSLTLCCPSRHHPLQSSVAYHVVIDLPWPSNTPRHLMNAPDVLNRRIVLAWILIITLWMPASLQMADIILLAVTPVPLERGIMMSFVLPMKVVIG